MTLSAPFVMQNNTLVLNVDPWSKAPVKSLSVAGSGTVSNKDRELFRIRIYDKEYSDADFTVVSCDRFEDRTEELITVHYALYEEALEAKVHFINDRKDTIRILIQIYDGYKTGYPCNSYLHVPLLSGMNYDGEGDTLLPPGCQFRSRDGKKILMPIREKQYSSDIRPPMVVLGKDRKHGFSISFPSYADLNNAGCCQNQNKIIAAMETENEIREHWLMIAPDASFNDTVELLITGLNNGWPEAFDRYRSFWASGYDFSEYDREDLKWIGEGAVHNFLFLYGKEGFDRETGRIDPEKLIRQGEEFGGYDTVTIWNQYPRLGVDGRSQWDFHSDFPGGRKAIREAVDEFHRHGIKVLLPYIPWDQGPGETTDSMGDEFAKMIANTDADGYQLDTMSDLPFSFRKKTDAVKAGVLLQSQGHPTKYHPIEFLTSSWDEFWRPDPMPEMDVLRFMLPQHIAPVISRWLRYEDKWVLIKRAEFGAAPIVIWQDIFGRWMPYTDEQKAEISRWKETYLEYRDIYQGPKPIPMYPTDTDYVYCNRFESNDGREAIYSFYSENDCEVTVSADLMQSGEVDAEVVLGYATATISKGRLKVNIAGYSVVHVKTLRK